MIPTIYVPVSDDTLWIINLYTHLFNKYWGKKYKVVFLGFDTPKTLIPDNFLFISLDKKQLGGAEGWSKYLYDYFSSISDEYIIFTLEDFLPTSAPNEILLDKIYTLILQNPSIGRFDLTWDLFANCAHKFIGQFPSGEEVIEIPKNVMYRVSCQPAIWKKSYLLKILQKTTNPWDFEMNGSIISDSLDEKILGMRDSNFINFPTKWIAKGAVSRHHPGKFNVLGLTTDCIKELVDLRLLKEEILQWGQWAGPVPSFFELGGYNFDLSKMPTHPASPTNWREWWSTYKK
jgi:hypothetical protein